MNCNYKSYVHFSGQQLPKVEPTANKFVTIPELLEMEDKEQATVTAKK
jgi:hypothetical protein